ncbi:MAG: serine hydrolase [Caldilineaceae bacterium]
MSDTYKAQDRRRRMLHLPISAVLFVSVLGACVAPLPAAPAQDPPAATVAAEPTVAPAEPTTEAAAEPPTAPEMGLHQAAFFGDVDTVRRHIAAGTDLNAADEFGSTPLTIAITFGKLDVARALIEGGADLTVTDAEGSMPLHLAALFGHADIVQALLDVGADRYAKNLDGATAFDIVAIPFADDIWLYDMLSEGLGPLGLVLDYDQIAATRPQIADMLRPSAEELAAVDYTPIPGADWAVSTPAEQGLDPLLVDALYVDAANLETLKGLLVIKNGQLVAEGYFNDGADDKARLQSVTKSITSASAGLALAEGCFSDIEQPIIDYFPSCGSDRRCARKAEITIRHLLQMRAGYPWEESTPDLFDLLYSGFRPSTLLDVPLVRDPGSGFDYSNLSSHLLGIVVARACATDLRSFAQEHLFGPLGIEAGEWITDWEGYYNGHADLHLTARDAAKFGLLYLDEGSFNGDQIIPADWVDESHQGYSADINDSAGVSFGRLGRYLRHVGYGYQWWIATAGDHDFAFAWGHGGQLIVVLDDLDMVVVTVADPMFGRHGGDAWKHEQSIINLVAKFVSTLPKQ